MSVEMKHVPVLLTETLKYLNVSRFRERDGVFVDATFGGGGHSMAILDHTGQGLRLIAIDRDRAASQRAISLQQRYGERFTLLQGNFADLSQLLDEVQVKGIDALLLDLGLSSYQLSNPPLSNFQRRPPATGFFIIVPPLSTLRCGCADYAQFRPLAEPPLFRSTDEPGELYHRYTRGNRGGSYRRLTIA